MLTISFQVYAVVPGSQTFMKTVFNNAFPFVIYTSKFKKMAYKDNIYITRFAIGVTKL